MSAEELHTLIRERIRIGQLPGGPVTRPTAGRAVTLPVPAAATPSLATRLNTKFTSDRLSMHSPCTWTAIECGGRNAERTSFNDAALLTLPGRAVVQLGSVECLQRGRVHLSRRFGAPRRDVT